MVGLQSHCPPNELDGTSIHVARPTATGRPELANTADPAERFRPSICSGHPITTHFSPAVTPPSIRTQSSPSTMALPSGTGSTANPLVQSTAAQRNSVRTMLEPFPRDGSGTQGE